MDELVDKTEEVKTEVKKVVLPDAELKKYRAILEYGMAAEVAAEITIKTYKLNPEIASGILAGMRDDAALAAEQARLAAAIVPIMLAWSAANFSVSDPERFELIGMRLPVVVCKTKKVAAAAAASGTNGTGTNGRGRQGQLIKLSGNTVVGTFDAIAAACAAVGIDGKGQNGKALLAKLSKAGYSYKE